jgi:hypothetical protein
VAQQEAGQRRRRPSVKRRENGSVTDWRTDWSGPVHVRAPGATMHPASSIPSRCEVAFSARGMLFLPCLCFLLLHVCCELCAFSILASILHFTVQFRSQSCDDPDTTHLSYHYLLFYSLFSSRLHREPFPSLLFHRVASPTNGRFADRPPLPSPSLAHSLFLRALSKVSSLCPPQQHTSLGFGTHARSVLCIRCTHTHTLCSYVRYRRDGLCGPRSRVLTNPDWIHSQKHLPPRAGNTRVRTEIS